MVTMHRDAVIVLDRDGRLVFASPEAETILARSLAEVMGQRLPAVLGPDHPLRAVLQPADGAQPSTFHYAKLEGPDGAARELRVAHHTIQDGAAITGTVIVIQHLEPIRAMESLVTHSVQMSELGELAAGVAHEVRNPLNGIAIQLELLRRHLAPDVPAVRQSLEVIEREVRRLDCMVRGFLDFVRPARLHLAPVAIVDLFRRARGTVEPEAARARVSVVAVLAPDSPAAIVGDPDLLVDALVRLLRNSIQAMPHGGRARLHAMRTPAGEVELRVEDQGHGIPPEDLDRVFRLYHTARPGAAGIGLSMVYRSVLMHGGRIRLDSRPGEGTAAIITLPASLVPSCESIA
jgi:signal transduction histidine kinase